MNKIDDPSQSQPDDDPSSFNPSAIDDLFEDAAERAKVVVKEAAKEAPNEPESPPPPKPHPEPIILTEQTEEAASAVLDAALSAAQQPPEPEVEPITAEEARAMMQQLVDVEARLKRHQVSREEATSFLRIASEALERFPKDDSTFEILKDEYLDAYFALDRTIRPTLEVPIRPEYEPRSSPQKPQKPQKQLSEEEREKRRAAAAAVTRDVETIRKPRWRLIAMLAVMLLLGGGRIAYYFLVEKTNTLQPELQQSAITGTEGSRVSLRSAGRQRDSFNRGVPVMTHLRVIRSRDGSLRARGVAIDIDSKTLRYNYKWFKDGALIKVESEGLLGADQVKPMSTYKVEATATDGKLTSAPMSSAPIAIKPRPKSGE